MRTFRAPLVLVAAAAAMMLSTVTAHAQDATVDVQDNSFAPDTVTVSAGDTVTWTQSGSNPHSITADDGSFDSHPECGGGGDCMAAGDEFSQSFDAAGTYAYYCRIHGAPGGVGMAGTVVVEAADAEPSPTPSPEPTDEPTDEPTAPAATGAMTVSDQTGDGSTVTVDSVTIDGADGWVVVHADTEGAPGPVLGHAALDEGTATDFVVTLDAPLTESQTVWPMLHVDAGVAGTYEFPGADGPVMDADGVITRSLAFTVEAAADEDADDTAAEESMPATGVPALPLAAAALLAVAAGATVVRYRRN